MYLPTPGGSRFTDRQNDLGERLIKDAHLLKVELFKTSEGRLIGGYHIEGQFDSERDKTPQDLVHELIDRFAEDRGQQSVEGMEL